MTVSSVVLCYNVTISLSAAVHENMADTSPVTTVMSVVTVGDTGCVNSRVVVMVVL